MNRLTEAADDDSIVQLTYDSLSRVLTEVQGSNPLGTTGKTVGYTWDAESNRTKIDYPSGFDANESRDALGRISAITDSSSNTVASFDLYGSGLREKKRTLANSTYTDVAYDGFRLPTDIDHKASGGTRFSGYAYSWDANDNPLMEKRAHKNGRGDVYSYDKANRLTKVLREVADPVAEVNNPRTQAYVAKMEYNMDDVFNLTSYVATPWNGSPVTTSYTTNAMNEYTAVGNTSPTYTDAGSLADDGTFLFKYDGHQHLIEVRRKSDNALIAEYAYDALGLGRRTTKTVSSAVTRYVYAGQQSIEEYDGTGSGANLSRLFVFGERIDQIVAMEAPDYGDIDQDANTSEVLRFSYHTQLIGSVMQVTGPSGSVIESYEYDPYGKPTMKNAAGTVITASAIKNPYLFTARQLDEETGLFYYRARHYSPGLRRFIQRDPLEYVDGPNALTYVRGRPTRATDPTGTQEEDPSDDASREAESNVESDDRLYAAYEDVLMSLLLEGLDSGVLPPIPLTTEVPGWVDRKAKQAVGPTQETAHDSPEYGEHVSSDPSTPGGADDAAHEANHHRNEVDPNNDHGQWSHLVAETGIDFTKYFRDFMNKHHGASVADFWRLSENTWMFAVVHALDEMDSYAAGAAAAARFIKAHK